jgi:polysaccharide pyruvyl transferase WcaK-like protein
MKKTKRVVLWGGWYGSKNVGDRAILLTIANMLGQALKQVDLIVLSANPALVHEYTKRHSNLSIEAIRPRRDLPRVILEIARSDLLVFGGGVPFFDRHTQLVAMIVLTLVARLSRTPYFLWCVSSLSVHSRLAKIVFSWVLAGASGITFRDEYTRVLFNSCGVSDDRMTEVADSAFIMENESQAEAKEILQAAGWNPDAGRSLVALTPRSLRSADGEAETHYSPQTSDQYNHEIEAFAAVNDWLWENGFQPIFVPMNIAAPDDDRVASKLIMERGEFGNKSLLINQEIYPCLAIGIYQQCQASFVSRVHGSILSMVGLCPVMMYAFDVKHRGIMQAMGCEDYVVIPTRDGSDDSVLMMKGLLNMGPILRQDYAGRLIKLRQSSQIPVGMITEILNAKSA